jgi:hypothetical protein
VQETEIECNSVMHQVVFRYMPFVMILLTLHNIEISDEGTRMGSGTVSFLALMRLLQLT